MPSAASKLRRYKRPTPWPERSARTCAEDWPTPTASTLVLPLPAPVTGSFWMMPVIVIVTGSLSASVTPTIEIGTIVWFTVRITLGLALAAVHTGGEFASAIANTREAELVASSVAPVAVRVTATCVFTGVDAGGNSRTAAVVDWPLFSVMGEAGAATMKPRLSLADRAKLPPAP